MPDASPFIVLSKLSIPVGMLTTIIGGSAYFSNMHSQIGYITDRFVKVEREFKAFEAETRSKQQMHGQMIHRIDGKLDQVIRQLTAIQRRLDRK